MTAADLCEELKIKESYLRTHWNDIIRSNKRIGIELVKIGRGDNAEYGIKSFRDKELRFTHIKYEDLNGQGVK